jgi:hypothetical protein
MEMEGARLEPEERQVQVERQEEERREGAQRRGAPGERVEQVLPRPALDEVAQMRGIVVDPVQAQRPVVERRRGERQAAGRREVAPELPATSPRRGSS